MKKTFTSVVTLFFASLFAVAQTPYAHYPLDGNASDISGNNLNGTIIGSPTPSLNRYSLSGKALDFSGSGDYITLPSAFDFPTMTVVVWFKAASLNAVTVIYSCDGSGIQNGQQKVILDPNQGSNTMRMRSGSAAWDQTVNLNEWYQVAFVRTPNLVKFFVNGNLVHSVNNPSNYNSIGNNNFATIGAGYTLANYFDGYIDDLLIYNTALTDGELMNNYNSLKDEIALKEELKTYTNSGFIHAIVKGDALTEIQAAEVYDYTGRLVSRTEGLSAAGKLNTEPLTTGIYLVSFLNTEARIVATRKVVIN
jgi:hypothetical protein